MALEALITDGIAHAGAGVALSLLDFITYKLTNPKTRRLEQKKECLRAIEALLDTEKPQEKISEEDEEKIPITGESSEETPTETDEIEQTSTDNEDSEEVSAEEQSSDTPLHLSRGELPTPDPSQTDSGLMGNEPTPSPSQEGKHPPAPLKGGMIQEKDTPLPPLKGGLRKDSMEYAEQVTIVRDYLRTSGIVKLQLPVFDRIKDGLRNLVFHEKINILSNVQKLGVAFGVEVLYDILFDFQHRAVTGIAASLYQIPAFFVGLWVGNGVKKVINLFLISGDERKIDKTIQQLIEETPIVDIIVKYVPSEKVKSDLAERGTEVYMTQLTRAGKGVYKRLQQIAETAKSTADEVIQFAQKQGEKEKQEQEQRRKRFDELTKGH
jgi:hypothetical protein